MTNQAIKCIVIDDEPLALTLITSYVEKIPDLEFHGGFTNTFKAKEIIEKGEIELVFCDIQIPGESGLELARILPRNCAVVFITAFEKYALEGFKVDAIDYLLKPVSFEDFQRSVRKVKRYLRPNVDPNAERLSITVRSERKDMVIYLDDIMYVKAMKDYMLIYTNKGLITTHCTMKQMVRQLPDPPFVHVHRSYIVNANWITSYNGAIVQVGSKNIPVADSRRKHTDAAFNEENRL